MSEEAAETPKIVSLSTRKAYRHESSDTPAEESGPDSASLKAAESILEQVKAGAVNGLIALTWDPKRRVFDMWINLPDSDANYEVALRTIGALDILKDILMRVAINEDTDPDEDDE